MDATKTSILREHAVCNLCLLKPQEPGQLEALTTWIKNVSEQLDAQWCAPPLGYRCSRSCSKIRDQMSDNPQLASTWHTIMAHLEECQSPQCELRTRAELREVLHLIECKQLEICEVRNELKEKKDNWSMAMHYSDETRRSDDLGLHKADLESLEAELQNLKTELTSLMAKKTSLCATMDTIQLDWRDEDCNRQGN
ncbi:unnamed protein product [Phytophthora lilii]|uniref:Unnamed protein product n=1 Tax=Phytophthora lilii TaxID=2077276 RepID=A0A9W6TCY7_9STRA|nr:unnamed protein product [Phytophthora lilii]